MIELRKFVSPEFVFGSGALELTGQYATNFGAEKALIVTDPGIIASGWTRKVARALTAVGVDYEVFSGVSPNPRVHEVMAGVEFYRKSHCDIIVAVGGGSPIDCAKGIGVASSNSKNVLEFEGVDNVEVPGPPLICIPTTAGASADVSQFAIVNNPEEKVKVSIISKKVVPDVALIDPMTTTTMGAYLTACTGIDAFVHAVEAFVSLANSPIFDLHALEAIRLIKANLILAVNDPDDMQAREGMMLGSLEAGLAFSNASLGAVHAMAHSLGGFLDLPHGECNAMLLEHVIDYNYETVPERYDQIGRVLGIDMTALTGREKKASVINEIKSLKMAAGISHTLGEKGLRASDIPKLAEKALNDACMVTNPRRPKHKRDIEAIYERSL